MPILKNNKKTAFFRFEASPDIGAGHAIRSCVIADDLVEKGWICKIVTSQMSYDFISDLNRFDRVDPDDFYNTPIRSDLLVVDHYDLSKDYETHFRQSIKRILVIDDLANRPHDCDILIDQTFGRDKNDYKNLVPSHCEILAGNDYALIRKEFRELRTQALEKRRNTKEIKRILISMGGSDPKNYTLKALEELKRLEYKGAIDIVLGFQPHNLDIIKEYIKTLENNCEIHINADMPNLTYEADLAIGAAGSSVWERYCLGLPMVLVVTADNQKKIYEEFSDFSIKDFLNSKLVIFQNTHSEPLIDGKGIDRLSGIICEEELVLKSITPQDKKLIFKWQNIPEIRKYFHNSQSPTWEEHSNWFDQRLQKTESPYWMIYYKTKPAGIISLTLDQKHNCTYDLSWYVIPDKQGQGLGCKSLRNVTHLVKPRKIAAFVKNDNISSHQSLQKAGFKKLEAEGCYISA